MEQNQEIKEQMVWKQMLDQAKQYGKKDQLRNLKDDQNEKETHVHEKQHLQKQKFVWF